MNYNGIALVLDGRVNDSLFSSLEILLSLYNSIRFHFLLPFSLWIRESRMVIYVRPASVAFLVSMLIVAGMIAMNLSGINQT